MDSSQKVIWVWLKAAGLIVNWNSISHPISITCFCALLCNTICKIWVFWKGFSRTQTQNKRRFDVSMKAFPWEETRDSTCSPEVFIKKKTRSFIIIILTTCIDHYDVAVGVSGQGEQCPHPGGGGNAGAGPGGGPCGGGGRLPWGGLHRLAAPEPRPGSGRFD